MSEFNTVEDNMRKRRKEATSLLGENQALCTITSFPRLVPVSTCMAGISENPGIKRADHNPALDPTALMLCRQFILITLCLVESVTLELQAESYASLCQWWWWPGGLWKDPRATDSAGRGEGAVHKEGCALPPDQIRGPPDGGMASALPGSVDTY